jgi:hypothetical protein
MDVDSTGNVYLGGRFTTKGSKIVGCLVAYDSAGTYFTPPTNGFTIPLGWIQGLKIDNNNKLYASGNFGTPFSTGTPSLTGIASWNSVSSVWQNLNGGMNGQASIMDIDSSNNLYCGGNFTQVTNASTALTVNYVAKWNPVTNLWSSLGSGLSSVPSCMKVSTTGLIYIGGSFTNPLNYIAKYEISTNTWSSLGPGLNGTCYAVNITSDGMVYAGGQFTLAGSTSVNNIAMWNPNTFTWSAMGTGVNNVCFSIGVDSNDLVYVGGQFTLAGGVAGTTKLAIWNPTTLSWYSTGIIFDQDAVRMIKIINNNVYISGYFYALSSTSMSKYIAVFSTHSPIIVYGTIKKNGNALSLIKLLTYNETKLLTWVSTYWNLT